MPVFIEQAAEGVFHGAGGRCENMGFNCGEVNDVFPDKPFGNHEAIWVYLVQAEELISNRSNGIPNVDPRFVALIKVHISKSVRLDDIELLVFPFPEVGVDHDGAVMAGVDI